MVGKTFSFGKAGAVMLAVLLLGLSGCRSGKPPISVDPQGAAVQNAREQTASADPAGADDTGDAHSAPSEDEEAGENSGVTARAEYAPVFSLKEGFLDGEGELVLSLPAGAPVSARIAWTDDCSEPAKGSKSYSAPIPVGREEATVIRAVCLDRSGSPLGPIVTRTYIRAPEGRFSTMVVSLTTEKKNLYGSSGIIDHPTNSGKAWERPCHVEIFTPEGERVIAQDAGIRVFGGSSRILPQKSFRLVARRDGYYDEMKYDGKGSFAYPFFPGRTVAAGEHAGELLEKYDRLILRNGGNDSMQATAADPTAMTLTRDAAANAFIAAHSDKVAYQASRFAAVYLNGEYYGILDMKEDIGDDYLKNVYGLDKDHVAVIKSELDTTRHCDKHANGGSCRFDGVWFYYAVDKGDEGELDGYEAMCRDALSALGGSGEEMDAAYRALSEKLDTESFMEYAALWLYMCNTDWPHNNLRLWRYTGEPVDGNPYTDGRWRFAARDQDFNFGRYECLVLPEIDTRAERDNVSFTLGNYRDGAYAYDGNYPDPLHTQGLLALCLHNGEFRAAFLDYCETLCGDADGLKSIMDAYRDQIAGEVPYHLDRWAGTVDGRLTPEVWMRNTEAMKTWADERPDAFRSHLDFVRENFG